MALRLVCLALLLAPLARGADVAIVRRVQTGPPGAEAQATIDRFANVVRDRVAALGLPVDMLPDTEVTAARLAGYKLVLFPHNPGTAEPVLQAAEAFVAGGGKLGLFYCSEPRLLKLVGVASAEYLGEGKLPPVRGVRFDPALLPGAPAELAQRSWNINRPVPAGAQVIGTWLDADGRDTGIAAATLDEHGFTFSHVLLGEDRPNCERFLLAALGRFLPDVWPTAVQRRLDAVGRVGRYADLDALGEAVKAGGRPLAAAALAKARTLRDEALARQAARDAPAAYDLAAQAIDAAQEAFVINLPSRPGELRGAWIHDAYGIPGWGWDRTIQVLADNGFNAIFPNMCWGAVADYPSDVLPVHPLVAEHGDQIQQCLDACRKYGVELHVWKVNWNMGGHTPEAIRQQYIAAGRTQRTIDGKDSMYLAPHLEENFRLERDAMLEIVRKYPVDGIHFDYIRYPGGECDFSDSARAAFEQWLGRKAEDWPNACYRGELRGRYNEWRRGNVSRLVQAVHDEAKQIRPNIQVSAAVFGGWDDAVNSVAQATEEWIDHGWLDFVCPMNYTGSDTYLRRLLERQTPSVNGRIPLYCGLGSWQHGSPAATAEQIRLTRELGADGFVCFELVSLSRGAISELAKGVTATPAGPLPHHSPHLVYRPGKGIAGVEGVWFAAGQPLEVAVSPPPGLLLRDVETEFGLSRDGETAAQPALETVRRGEAVVCRFTPDRAGWYRVEATGKCRDGRPLLSRSGPLRVLSAEQARELVERAGPPRFAGKGRIKVGVWHNAYGAAPLLTALRAVDGLDVAPLYNFKPASLAACRVLLLPQPRFDTRLFMDDDNVAAVKRYLERGGALMVTHALVGIRGYTPFAPDVAKGGDALSGRGWQVSGEHPVTAGLPAGTLESTFGDRIALVPGARGTVVAATPDGQPLVAVGQAGKGREEGLHGIGEGLRG
ncbi:MAG: family 10 glycosylhydrolase, partial [Armatimonadetes bacterium]|nr:family 10 glycosylhydrolase [Armatimonadota bacterium]